MGALTPPPSPGGVPVLGHLFEFGRDPVSLFRRGHERHGDVFSIRLGRTNAAVLVGPEHHRFVFGASEGVLRRREAYDWMAELFGERFPVVADGEVHRRYQAVYRLPFESRQMDAHLAAIDAEVDEWITTLGKSGELELAETFGRLFVRTITRAFLGEASSRRLGDSLYQPFRDIAGALDFVRPHWLAPGRDRRRDAARDRIRATVRRELADRRAHGGEDVLAMLLEARCAEMQTLPEHQIVDLVAGLLWIGHETTTGYASWALVQLLEHPAYHERVVTELAGSEQGEIRPTATCSPALERALKETERMRSPVSIVPRYNAAEYELGSYRVPRGWLTIVSPPVSHRLERVFERPDAYEPDRFGPAGSGERLAPLSLVGFGAGARKCTGTAFALAFVRAVLSQLVRRYELTLVGQPEPTRGPAPSRPLSCGVRYRARR